MNVFLCKAQSAEDVQLIEQSYKACMQEGIDTSLCARTYLREMDSVLSLVYEKVRIQLPASEKIGYLKEQQNWAAKKSEFFKKQEENFSFNLKEGNWPSTMIWLVNQSKADFLKKRALSLAKRLKE